MNELRRRHLGIPSPDTGRPSVREQLDTAYADALDAAKRDHGTPSRTGMVTTLSLLARSPATCR
jgi:hypothetical protein